MMDNALGDNVVMGLHMDIAITCAKASKEYFEKNQYGEAKHELSKAILEMEEARTLYRKMGGK